MAVYVRRYRFSDYVQAGGLLAGYPRLNPNYLNTRYTTS